MNVSELSIHPSLKSCIPFEKLHPAQEKSIKAGLLERKSLLICSPTASGKTLVAEIACLESILNGHGKALYVVPLKALASEKKRMFTKQYGEVCRIAMSIGDTDVSDQHLGKHDLIIVTAEKLDSLLRHQVSWINEVGCIVIDEVHLLNDASRGPTLEVVITMLKMMLPKIQWIFLSATIGNAPELSEWLESQLVTDEWRPVELRKGIYCDGVVEF